MPPMKERGLEVLQLSRMTFKFRMQ